MTRLRPDAGAKGGGNPAYVNARIRSRRASLLDESDYRKLVRMGPDAISRYLEETEYEREMNELGARYRGVDLIEYALNANLSRHFQDLLDWSDGQLYDQLVRYLRKFDTWNIKTILRGIYTDTPRDEIEADLISAGEFTKRDLDRLLEAQSIDDVIERLSGTIYYDPLIDAYDEYEELNLLVPLENAVDRAMFEHMISGIDVETGPASRVLERHQQWTGSPAALFREFLAAEIDLLNVRNALRIAKSGSELDPSSYFIEGGRLFSKRELGLLTGDLDGLVATIRDSVYGEKLDDALAELEDAESLLEVEQAIDRALVEYGDLLGSRYPVSVCPIIAYVLAKELEVQNVIAIARGREAGLSEEEIREELVMP